jgi:hypothetical protein
MTHGIIVQPHIAKRSNDADEVTFVVPKGGHIQDRGNDVSAGIPRIETNILSDTVKRHILEDFGER